MLRTHVASVVSDSVANEGWPILTANLRFSWIVFVAATVLSELLPVPPMSRSLLYFVWTLKALCFGLVGFIAPLAFERFNAFIRGLGLGAITATGIELVQGLIGHGHSFHVHELLMKLLLIFAGFCIAIVFRYERAIVVGGFRIPLKPSRPYGVAKTK